MKIPFRRYWIILVIFLSLLSSACISPEYHPTLDEVREARSEKKERGAQRETRNPEAYGGGCPEGPPCPGFEDCMRRMPSGLPRDERLDFEIKCQGLP